VSAGREPIAIIGMGCRYAGGAAGPAALWQLLTTGVDAVRPIRRWDHAAWQSADPEQPGRTTQAEAALLDGIEAFDAAFFGIAPREAEAMDPQQRLVLEVAWEALEDAAIPPDRLDGVSGGVYLGLYNSNYGLIGRGSPDPSLIGAWSASGTHTSIAPGRIAFRLGLTGPAVALDTACSSSLVAVHLAVQSLRSGECEVALAGGVHLILSPLPLVASAKLGAASPTSRCRAFDAAADGFAHGEGCGVVVLKRLSDAVAAGDRVLAVIHGSAVNQDGRSAGLTAPSGPAQEAVLRAALADAALAPAEIDAIEAHGTGTALGDPIEMHALRSVFAGDRARPLAVGSAKTNIGHTEAAAGIAGLIKAVLMLRYQQVAPSLHFKRLNPHIDLAGASIAVPTRLEETPLRHIGVSSFGFSGTNAHIVLGAAPTAAPAADPRPAHLLPLSARDPAALTALVARWQDALAAPGADLPALARTAATGRAAFPHRIAITARDAAAAAEALARAEPTTATRPRIAFLVTGQGSAFPGMARGLAETAPVFRRILDRCDAVMGLPAPLARLFEDGAALARADIAQPALFALSAGLGALWRSWGVEPVALLGHSLGEYAAAHLAGVLALEDAARLVAARGRLTQALPEGGAMAALLGPNARAALARHPALELSGENGSEAITVAGPQAAVAALLDDPALARAGLEARPLAVSHAFHSRLLDPMLDALEAEARAIPHQPPAIPVIGNLEGTVVARHDAAYWRAHARQPVRFAQGLATLAAMGVTHAVELGAMPVLSGLARAAMPALVTLPSLARARPGQAGAELGWTTAMQGVARLWQDGAEIDWPAFHQPYPTRTTSAPTYPFQRERFWLADPTLDRPAAPATTDRAAPEVGDERVTGFYDELTTIARHYADPGDGSEGHLTFGLMPAPRAGFSWLRALFAGPSEPEGYALLRRAQHALKQAIFAPIDFNRAHRVLDFGCGHAADLCDIALRHPHLRLDGCTISAEQVQVGRARAARAGFAERLRIHHRDSARDPFPGRYDVIFGVEVSGLIEDKAGLFDNIRDHLEPGGALVIADFVAAGDGIAAPDTASFTSTAEEWARLLADRGLRLTDCVDTSAEVAHFLDDPGFEAEVDHLVAQHGLSDLTRRHLLSNDNIGRALRRGVMRYVLLVARQDATAPVSRLLSANRARLAAPDRWEQAEPWRGWFHRLAWQPDPVAEAVAQGASLLAGAADAAAATDRLARAWIAAARLADCVPAPRFARLHAHLSRLTAHPEDPTTLPVPDLPEARLLARSGPHLRAVLEDRADPLDLLFGDGGAAAEALYAASPAARAVNGIASAAFTTLLEGRGATRVLEIGCGTGGTTQTLLPRLRAGDSYRVTDVSPAFVQAARRRFGLEGEVLDITVPPIATGIADIVVAANVLHATPDLRRTLRHAISLLAEDGALLLVENAGELAWGDLTFGLTDGMWAFTDTDLRPGHALLPPTTWIALLAELGFVAEAHQPGDARTAMLSGQFVLLARRARASTDIVWRAPRGASAEAVLAEALPLLQQAASRPTPPRVWIGTDRARAVTVGDTPDPAQATLWGLANALAIEAPELRLTLVDADDPAALEREVAAGTAETRIAWRNGQRHLARLDRMAAPEAAPALRVSGTWLVTGGLAGIGLAVARWLAEQGVTHLVLLGRTAHDIGAFPPGVRVTTVIGDVADEAVLAALLSAIEREGPPLIGVMHAAGVLDDGLLAQQTPTKMAAVLRPKLQGARLLDRLTRRLAPRHFVLFSSSAALLGSAAQVNHAAANAAMDAIAEARRAEGLPALSIAWGAWDEVGAAARAGAGVARRGLLPMPPDQALAALGLALSAEAATLGILDVDWGRFLARFAPHPVPPVFATFPGTASTTGTPEAAPSQQAAATLRDRIEAAPQAERATLLLSAVRETVARILGLTAGVLPPAEAPLRELGLDSLMTVELRNALATACETRLPATLVFEYPSCSALAQHLGATVFVDLLPAATGDALDAMDEDELTALLEAELGAAGAALGASA
jgi:acyl transferase domain-containing protein/cyclopropane fatty-acyl-phospholipid synthase-like methyltransferase